MGIIHTSRDNVERQLHAYGEDAVAVKLAFLTDSDFVRIGQRAFDYACKPAKKSGAGMMFAKAIAYAAVEVIEGSARELRRKRRLSTQSIA